LHKQQKLSPKNLTGNGYFALTTRTPNVWGISRKQAQSLLGSKLKYRNGALNACKQRVTIDKVEQRDVSPTQFLADWKVRFEHVGIVGTSIREITLNGNAGGNCFEAHAVPGENVYLKSPDELLVGFEGVYFRAARTPAGKGAK
jgi:hypothetical protein